MKRDPKFDRLAPFVSPDELAAVAALADEIVVEPDTVLMRQGWTSRNFFLVEDGVADVYRGTRRDRSIGAGASFGECGLLDCRPAPETVRSRTRMRLFVFGPREFAAAVRLPGFADSVLHALVA